MTAQRDAGLQFALVKDVLDPKEQKREVEEKIRAAEEWNNLLLENAARMDMYSYGQSKTVVKEIPNAGRQLSLGFEKDPVSERS